VDDSVIVSVGEKFVAFNVTTGEYVWQVACEGANYSSPQRISVGDVTAVLLGDVRGLFAVQPETGNVLWRYKPTDWEGAAICQPQQIDGESLIIPIGGPVESVSVGVARLRVRRDGEEWRVDETWSSKAMRTKFSDFVFHNGYIYGFGDGILTCLDAQTGERKWRGGRYGHGQLVLLADVEQLIVVTEQGELVLLNCNPKEPDEQGRVPVLEGKTWNHPVFTAGRIFVRNSDEAACYEL
jgi:outer membrane protein assembly factor BamB